MMSRFRRLGAAALVFVPVLGLSGCGTVMVASAVVGTTVTAGVIVADTAIGAGALAIDGAGALIEGTGSVVEAVVD